MAVRRAKANGILEIKRLFPVIFASMSLIGITLILAPIDILSYIEVGVSSLTMIPVLIICYLIVKESIKWRSPTIDYDRIYLLGMLITTCIWSLHVVVADLDDDRQTEWTWLLYIAFPMVLIAVSLAVVSKLTFYYFWNCSWTLFCFGLMMIITGSVTDYNVTIAMWIIGLCFVLVSAALPFAVYFHLKRILIGKRGFDCSSVC